MPFGYQYWLVYLPRVQPASFLLFTHRPDGATKLRDYSFGVEQATTGPSAEAVYGETVEGVSRFRTDAHLTTDAGYWHRLTLSMNRRIPQAPASPMVTTPSPAERKGQRPCSSGPARRGSQMQIQRYINEFRDSISAAILTRVSSDPAAHIRWVSPLAEDDFQEYRDTEFLERLGLEAFSPDLAAFWPDGGPCWDALGVIELPDGEPAGGVILVEAKSHRAEVHGPGCQARSPRSIERIRAALSSTMAWCGADPSADWMGSLYQYANRLAHLYFFLERLRRPAWLVNLYLTDDPIDPTSEAQWGAATRENQGLLGLRAPARNSVEVFLPALPEPGEAKMKLQPGRRIRPSPVGAAGAGSDESFAGWRRRWDDLALYTGVELPDVDERRQAVLSHWRRPIPGEWKRGPDPQLLSQRYRRGDRGRPRSGEHQIEHEILEECFQDVTVLGGRLVDGVNAMPLTRDGAGGRAGNVEADLYLLVKAVDGFKLYIVEVKSDANHAWYATVENLRQVRLLMVSEEALGLFQRRNPEMDLPASIPVQGLVLAPSAYYSSPGQKSKSTSYARLLIGDMRTECGCHVQAAVWNRSRKSIDPVQ